MDNNKIKEKVKEYLTQYGWPARMRNPDEFVVRNLDPIFVMLLKEKLVTQDQYEDFIMVAHIKYHFKGGNQ